MSVGPGCRTDRQEFVTKCVDVQQVYRSRREWSRVLFSFFFNLQPLHPSGFREETFPHIFLQFILSEIPHVYCDINNITDDCGNRCITLITFLSLKDWLWSHSTSFFSCFLKLYFLWSVLTQLIAFFRLCIFVCALYKLDPPHICVFSCF